MGLMLGVGIDHSRIAWIHNSEQYGTGTVKLTTITDSQQNAEINFYLKIKNRKYLLSSEIITAIPPLPAGKPSIDIEIAVRKNKFSYRIVVNGNIRAENSISIRKYYKKKKFLIAGPAILIAAAVIASLILLNPEVPLSKPARAEKTDSLKKSPQPAEISPFPEEHTEAPADMPAEEPAAEPESGPEASITYTESLVAESCSVYFKPDSAELTTETIAGLEKFVSELPSPENFENGEIILEVRGHCARYGTEEGRAELSRERAENVHSFLNTRWGIETESEVTGAGASEPVTLDRRQQHLNRRVDISVKGNITVRER